MRKSINGLSILVAEQLELDPLSGHLFAFCNRKRDIVKILYWDRNGFCLWQKRLEKDRFRWPDSAEDVLDIDGRELSWLIDGLSLDQKCTHRRLSYSTVI
jgi:transposase